MISDDPFSRQSFLGPRSQEFIERCVVGIIGLGGGGSHIVQQLAHLGFLRYVIFDCDRMVSSNLNRLVGAVAQDVIDVTPKVDIAERLIRGVRPSADVRKIPDIWQKHSTQLRQCDLVFGCVDGFDQRRQLEVFLRRYLIPLIDIGMDVHQPEGRAPAISGQVMLSMPGHACLTCMGFLNDARLTREAARYGDAGMNPQVVWSNGVLASTAVGLGVDLLTDWSLSLRGPVYLSYRGNEGTLLPDPLLSLLPERCPHFPLQQAGPPQFRVL